MEQQSEKSQDLMKQLVALANLANKTEEEIEQLEEKTKEKNKLLRTIVEEDIPNLMQELTIKSFKLEDGSTISVGMEVHASIPAASKEAAFNWLEQNQFGSLIKTDVTVTFGREQLEKAVQLAEQLREAGLEPELDRGVHASTLKAFIKEQLEAGKEVPLLLFGANAVNTAKIKAPRKKKAQA